MMNVEEDIRNHVQLVTRYIRLLVYKISLRGPVHDFSKLQSPEKEMNEEWRPKLDLLDIQSQEYKDALTQMGPGLHHHYRMNRHHPEHYADGVNDMNLIDIAEMLCDWQAAARRGQPNGKVNMEWAKERFGIGNQLARILENTLKELNDD